MPGIARKARLSANPKMKRVPISNAEGAAQASAIELDCTFTSMGDAVIKPVFHLSKENKRIALEELRYKLDKLNS